MVHTGDCLNQKKRGIQDESYLNKRPYHGCDAILTEDKAVWNYSVCMGIQGQITFSKIEFYTICELQL